MDESELVDSSSHALKAKFHSKGDQWKFSTGITVNEDALSSFDLMLTSGEAFKIVDVLFKPTKACIKQFRTSKEDFTSYFIANNNLHKEDKGFALEPWKKITFENFNITKIINI